MNGLKNFMNGRYGTDQLTLSLLVLGMILTFLANAFKWHAVTMFSNVIFLACIYRALSKNISARQTENIKFLKLYNPAKTWITGKYNIIKSLRYYKYFKCPNCKQEIRAPRGKGKILITCQKCKNKFIQKT